MASTSKELVVLDRWQHTLRNIIKKAIDERNEALKQYDEGVQKCTDQAARDTLYIARNQRLNDIRIQIIDAMSEALGKNKADTANDLDILNAKEHLALTVYLSDQFTEAEPIYREILGARLEIKDEVERTTLTRHMLLATLHQIVNHVKEAKDNHTGSEGVPLKLEAPAGVAPDPASAEGPKRDLALVHREALELAMANIQYTTKENKKLAEDVDMALSLLNKLQEPDKDDQGKMAIALRKKIELLEISIAKAQARSPENEQQLIAAKIRLFRLLSQSLQQIEEAKVVAISLEPNLLKELENPTMQNPRLQEKISEFLTEIKDFLAESTGASPAGTPAYERQPSFGISRSVTWHTDPLEDEEFEKAALFDAGATSPGENPTESARWIQSFLRFRQKTLENAVVNIQDRTQTPVRVAIIDTGIDPGHQYIKDRRWTPWFKVGDTQIERYHDFSKVKPPAPGSTQKAPKPAQSQVQPQAEPQARSQPQAQPQAQAQAQPKAQAQPQTQPQAQPLPQPEDKDGHGTFIAGILLQLVPQIDLRIARIGETREDIQTDAGLSHKVAQAVKHAAEEWDSEIISISFCCKETKVVRDAIRAAVSKDILLFAATGNSGYNEDLIYPATERDVFKVMACNHFGTMRDFSTPSLNKEYSLLTLGCAIESTWPASLRAAAASDGIRVVCPRLLMRNKATPKLVHKQDGSCTCKDAWAYMSGTSFAAPVAAAFAAVVYQFYNAHQSQIKPGLGIEDFKSISSMRRVLKAMSLQTNEKYSYLRPPNHRANQFTFRPIEKNAATNAQGKTYDEFFISALQTVITRGDGPFE